MMPASAHADDMEVDELALFEAMNNAIHLGHTCMRNATAQLHFESLDAAGRVIFEKCEHRMLDSLFSHPADSLSIAWLHQSGLSDTNRMDA